MASDADPKLYMKIDTDAVPYNKQQCGYFSIAHNPFPRTAHVYTFPRLTALESLL